MILAIVLLYDVLYSYMTNFPYYVPKINYISISFISCALYQVTLTLIFNFCGINNHTTWLICMFSSILVIPISGLFARYKYKKLIEDIYTSIHDKKILQKTKINKEYLSKLENDQFIESIEDIGMLYTNKLFEKKKLNILHYFITIYI